MLESVAMCPLVLASTSPYRRQLLQRLQVEFVTIAPRTDEAILPGEPPDARALRLAEEKALAPAADYPAALIIGGDQTIAAGAQLFDKPGSRVNAIRQLLAMRGRQLTFYTAVALALTKEGAASVITSRLVTHYARFRHTDEAEVSRYVDKENAFNCAGGAQIEGLGIALLEDIRGGDPTALIGMPLMVVADLLRRQGLAVP